MMLCRKQEAEPDTKVYGLSSIGGTTQAFVTLIATTAATGAVTMVMM